MPHIDMRRINAINGGNTAGNRTTKSENRQEYAEIGKPAGKETDIRCQKRTRG